MSSERWTIYNANLMKWEATWNYYREKGCDVKLCGNCGLLIEITWPEGKYFDGPSLSSGQNCVVAGCGSEYDGTFSCPSQSWQYSTPVGE